MSGFLPDDSPLDLALRGATHEHRLTDHFALPVQLEVWLQMTQCNSVLGPLVDLHASLVLSDLRARVASAEPARGDGAPGRVTTIECGLVRGGERLTRPQRPARLRVARPVVRFTVADHAGNALGDGAVTMRCADGPRGFLLAFPVDVWAVLWFTPHERAGAGEPRLEASGDLHFPRGVTLHVGDPAAPDAAGALALAGSADAVGRPPQVVELIPPGRSVPLQHDQLKADLFRGPDVSVRFVDAANRAYGSLHRLGPRVSEARPGGAAQ